MDVVQNGDVAAPRWDQHNRCRKLVDCRSMVVIKPGAFVQRCVFGVANCGRILGREDTSACVSISPDVV